MLIFAIFLFILVSGCSSLIADFEDDRVGSRPSVFPDGYPDDSIRLGTAFEGSVRAFPIIDPTGISGGRQSLEVSGNSVISFRSEPIKQSQRSGRHSISFLFTDGTARGKTISIGGVTGREVRIRIVDDTLTIRGADGRDEQEFSIRTISTASKASIIVDPPTGRIRVIWRTRNQTIGWSTAFAEPGEAQVTRFTIQFSMDNGGSFPRGRIIIDEVRARWSPRISIGAPS